MLVLVFLDTEGKERMIKIEDPRSDLTPLEVETAMNAVVAKGIFHIASASKAYILTTTTQDIYEQAV
jgi:hypothetical protein